MNARRLRMPAKNHTNTDPRVYFLEKFDLGDNALLNLVGDSLRGAEDGELYCESKEAENLTWQDGRVENASYLKDEGFGLRRVNGDCALIVSGNDFKPELITEAARNLRAVSNTNGDYSFNTPQVITPRYASVNPLEQSMQSRVLSLQKIDEYIRALDSRVKDVSLSLSGETKHILIVRGDGIVVSDVRPLVRFNIGVLVEENGKREWGTYGFGGREKCIRFLEPASWQYAARKAFAEAVALLEARPCPAGEMPVIVGPAWGAVLLHEAIGHGLEGDFIRKKTSVFTELLGKTVAHKDITIVDDGTIPNRRGSLTVDDEGTRTQETVLVERGTVVGFMHDRLSARHFGVSPTGNGRRQSYGFRPIPRMRNTLMYSGPHTPEEILRATQKGLYFESFSGGQVDITTGQFVFKAQNARIIENGVLGAWVKGATLIGSGFEVLTHVDMVGNDMSLDPGIGTCGKDGQGVPVGVGQPTIRINGGVTVGGTEGGAS